MACFIPSFFQKRILRYALSRLDLLDTDALDLDKLDITWGKTSTVEVRDIGGHTKVSDFCICHSPASSRSRLPNIED